MTALRVLANLCSMVPGRVGGSEVHATRLLAAVASLRTGSDRLVELELAAMAGTRSAHPELADAVWHEARWSGNNRALRIAVESTWLARRSSDFEVVHHFGGRLPARRAGSAVLTIHDVQPLDEPQNFSAVKRRYLASALPRSAQAAAVVAVPSKWVAERVVERLGAAPDRIRLVPSTYRVPARAPSEDPGQGSSSQPTRPEAGSEPRNGRRTDEAHRTHEAHRTDEAHRTQEAHRVLRGRRFVLYPAATYPHKNHDTLIAAHAAVWARHGDTMLVFTGGVGRAHRAVAEQVALTPGVVHLGRVDDSTLAALTDTAAAVTFPSRYEGFGLPVLEAMEAGTPVVAAAATALPEVVGDGGTLVDPDDLDGWVDALLEVRSGSSRIDRAVERGRVRAADYAPDRAATRLIDAWQAAGPSTASGVNEGLHR